MAEPPGAALRQPSVWSIPVQRSFTDALAAGLIRQHGRDPLALANGRILLPTNRAARSLIEAFVRLSGGGLVLPRLIAIGDPELDERIGGALDPLDLDHDLPPALAPLDRILLIAQLVRQPGDGAGEAVRVASELARALDALAVAEVPVAALHALAPEAGELARHWQVAFDRLRAVTDAWPAILATRGRIDLATRRSLQLRAIAARWQARPPEGFTIAAGITTTAPAVAALLAAVARLPGGAVVLPGLVLADAMSADEWDALGPDDDGRGDDSHPQYALKLLLDRIGVARGEVQRWPAAGRASAPAARGRAIAQALTAADFSDKWNALPAAERRLTGVRCAEFADAAAEAQAIAIALREAAETPGRTAALVTPDRVLATRVSAHLLRWGIEADDSAGQPLATLAPGTLLAAIASAVAEQWAPVALLALAKHPLAGGAVEERAAWLDAVRELDLALRGPRPRAGLAGVDAAIEAVDRRKLDPARAAAAWAIVRPVLAAAERALAAATTLVGLAAGLREAAGAIAGDQPWRGAAGRAASDWLAEVEAAEGAALALTPAEWPALLAQLMGTVSVRRPYGGHPRIFIWGLLEARRQQAELMILGGLNEGTWPRSQNSDPWLAPRLRRLLGLAGPDSNAGLAAHDFASAIGAPRVLLTRARRQGRAPTVASRLWLRLQAMTGGIARDVRLERYAAALDSSPETSPVGRPRPSPPVADRPRRIAVTDLDRLKADPFAFYAKTMLRLRPLDPVDADHSAAWKGTAVHEVLEAWLKQDDCDPAKLAARARTMVEDEAIHPMLRALWRPRLWEAIDYIAAQVAKDVAAGRHPLAAEVDGKAVIAGVELVGKADRIDRLANGALGLVDYKTGQPPGPKAIREGYALQLGLLALIAGEGGFDDIPAGAVAAFEYWSLARDKDQFGKRSRADKEFGADEFIAHARAQFGAAAARWLTGDEPFVAKLDAAYAPYEDYDQLMRLEEWYGRD